VSGTTVNYGSSVTYTATVTPSHSGPAQPSGSVSFLDGGNQIAYCKSHSTPLTKSGAFFTATCTLTYGGVGTHHITAAYGGDGSFSGSSSSLAQTVTVRKHAPPSVTTLMHWTFYYAPSYSKVLALILNSAPIGSHVTVMCHGHGCPFVKLTEAIRQAKLCKATSKHHCGPQRPGAMDFVSRFRGRRLVPGAQIIVEITQPGWIGKYYSFTIIARHPPRVLIRCLPPGSTRPQVRC
jgi:hypothetical protein